MNPESESEETVGDINQRIAALSPEKRTLFERGLMVGHGLGNNDLSIPRSSERGPSIPSFGQERLWFLNQLEPDSLAYNLPKAFRIKGVLNVDALEKALHEIVSRHEVLRTTLAVVDGSPKQIIAEKWSFVMPVVDLRRTAEAKREEELQNLIQQEARRPFNLSQDLMLRATLLRLEDETWVLILVMHHIANDAWSLGILFHELGDNYESISVGKPSALLDLPIQYADYSRWQRGLVDGEGFKHHLSYWKEQLGPGLSILELPTDRPRPAVETFRGSEKTHVLSRRLTDALEELSRQQGVTLFMTLLAAFQTLLYRYTTKDDIWVGSPIAGRTRDETEGLIGFFVGTLVLRTDLSGNPRFKELLGRVREVVLGAHDHQDLPFEKLVEELGPERSLSHSPLFNVMFALQTKGAPALQLLGLTVSSHRVDIGTAKFDLTVSMTETEAGLRGLFEYNTDLFDDATIDRMMGHLETLLEGIVEQPDQTIADLPMLTAAESHQLLFEWNETRADYPQDKCIHQLFEDQVERTPEAIAVVFEGQRLTYRDLNARANQVAHYLQKLGVGPESLVGICVERSLEMLIGILGILKAGGAYLPLEPTYPKDRLVFMLEDARASIVVTQDWLRGHLPEDGGTFVCLDADWAVINQESLENLNGGSTADSLAYVIYTSGSTGEPKGVQIPHRALANCLSSMAFLPGLTNQDSLLAVTTLSFDIAALELFLPLTVGARLEIVSREVASDGFRLADALDASGATTMQATPATWQMLLAAGWQGCEHLKKILCGGEVLTRDLANRLLDCCATLWNLYGPTETTIWSTLHQVTRNEGSVPIGQPIANTQIYILDEMLQPVPVGVTGNLYVGGVQVGRGYLNRPELTSESFPTDPFRTEAGARLFKTGDLARHLPDGNIEFLGRIDDQLKIRGFRVEPGEVEAVLRLHPGVGNVVVVGQAILGEERPTKLNTVQNLIAHVVPSSQLVPSEDELRGFVKEKLPSYMVPSAFLMSDSLPLTANGKVDRQRLPSPDQIRRRHGDVFESPRNRMEFQLAEIWQEVLGVSRVGVTDDFFELGGYSLLAVSLLTKINDEVGGDLPLSILFQAPTVAQMAVAITQRLRDDGQAQKDSSVVAFQPHGSKPPFFWLDPNPFLCHRLADYLGPDQPIYSLSRFAYDPRKLPFPQIKAHALQHAVDILAVQREGPYYLAGSAFTGVIAIEIARQLQAHGHEVGLVALFDTYPPDLDRRILGSYYLGRINHHWKQLPDLGTVRKLAYVFSRLRPVPLRLFRQSVYMGFHKLGLDVPKVLQDSRWIRRSATSIGVGYSKKPYDGDVTLFRAKDRGIRSNFADHGWGDVVSGRLEVCEVPGDHCTLFTENFQELADKLGESLHKARSRHPANGYGPQSA